MKTRNQNQISCNDVRELMFEYLDGELDSRTSAKLTAHLMDCRECQTELEGCRKLLDEIGKVDYHVPEALHGNVMALVGCTAQDKPSKFKRVFGSFGCRTAAIGTFAAACAVVAIVILNRGFINANSGIAEPVERMQIGIGAAYQPDGSGSTETVGALKFASPMTSVDTTTVAAPSKTEVVENSNAASDGGEYGYSNSLDVVTTETETGANLKITSQPIYESPIVMTVNNFVKSGTAVMIIPVDSNVGATDGEEIKLSGLENLNCREIIGDKVYERLLVYESELNEDGANYQTFLPDGTYDSLIIMNSEPVDEELIAEAENSADDEAAVAETVGETAQ